MGRNYFKNTLIYYVIINKKEHAACIFVFQKKKNLAFIAHDRIIYGVFCAILCSNFRDGTKQMSLTMTFLFSTQNLGSLAPVWLQNPIPFQTKMLQTIFKNHQTLKMEGK